MKRVITIALALAAGLLLYVTPGRADALLATNYRCTTHSIEQSFPYGWISVTICWQYTYRAQNDGTGVYNESLHVDITNGCTALGDDHKVRNMSLTMVNPNTGAHDSFTNMSDMSECSTTRDLELAGRDVGSETASWDLSVNPEHGSNDWVTEFNDCLSLGSSHAGPC